MKKNKKHKKPNTRSQNTNQNKRKGTKQRTSSQIVQKKKTAKKQVAKSQKTREKIKISFDRRAWISMIVIAIACFVAYFPSLKNEFTNWDDDIYVTDNIYMQRLADEDINVLITKNFVSNFHPLTMLSLTLDHIIGTSPKVKEWGEKLRGNTEELQQYVADPLIFHFTNLLIHILNTLLVFWFIYMLYGFFEKRFLKDSRSWKFEIATIAAALFGIHTLHVESVAWVAERKDVLYTFFYLLAAISYVYYVRRFRITTLILSILLFTCALLSKGMAVSLAVTLFAIDYLTGRKILSRKVIIEKIPFLILAVIFGIRAVTAQRTSGALAEEAVFDFHERIAFASYGLTQYILKLIYPFKLSGYYSYPDKTASGDIPPVYWVFPLVSIALTILFIIAVKKKWKLTAFSILFFILNILLVLQLIPVGNAVMADRYSYVPSIGFFFLLAVGIKKLAQKNIALKSGVTIAFCIYFLLLGYLTFERTKIWKNSLTFWDDVLKYHKNVPAAWNNRGNARKDIGDFEGAIADYNEAIKIKPDHTKAYNNRGIAKKNLGRVKEAIRDYDKSIALKPDYDDAYSNRGNAKRLIGDLEGAIKDYNKAIELKPYFAKAYSNRGASKIDMNDYDGAIADLKKAIEIRPQFVEAYYNIANAYFNTGKYKEAIDAYTDAIQLRPNYVEAYANRAGSKFRIEDFEGAIADYTKALQLNPDYIEAYVNRGGTRYNIKDFAGAVKDYTEVIKRSMDMLKNGDKQKAAYARANLAKGYYIRGLSYIELNQKEKACSDLNTAWKMGVGQAKKKIDEHCK